MVEARLLGLRRIRRRRHPGGCNRKAGLRTARLLCAAARLSCLSRLSRLSGLSGLSGGCQPLVLPLREMYLMKRHSFTLLATSILVSTLIQANLARAEDTAEAAAPPIPTLHCEIKKMSACSPD